MAAAFSSASEMAGSAPFREATPRPREELDARALRTCKRVRSFITDATDEITENFLFCTLLILDTRHTRPSFLSLLVHVAHATCHVPYNCITNCLDVFTGAISRGRDPPRPEPPEPGRCAPRPP